MLPWKMLAVLAAAALNCRVRKHDSGLERRRDWSSARQAEALAKSWVRV